MVKKRSLPFKVGDEAEARTFVTGYRGAWFRCKIRDIIRRKGDIEYLLEYYDFPEEKPELVNPFQVPVPNVGMTKMKQRMLMIRPPYPPMYHENKMPCVRDNSEVAVLVNGTWKVGDLVEWWTNDCFWSGRIKQLVGGDKAMIEFSKPPLGEGTPDEKACLKDLRPSLDWSPEYGWILPTPGGEKTGCPRARLIKPGDQGQELEEGNRKAGLSPNESLSPRTSVITLAASDELKGNETGGLHELSSANTVSEELDAHETSLVLDGGDRSTRKTTCLSDTDSSLHMRETLAEPTAEVAEGNTYCSSLPLKKYPASGGMTTNSMGSNTVESAILDLEELLNKVKWLKSILNNGIPSSEAARPQWKVVEHIASSFVPK